jgi:hypothetical protein
MTGNNWSCYYYEGTLKTQLKESNIKEATYTSNEVRCLQNPVPSEVKSSPRIDRNSTRFQHHEDIKDPKLTNDSKAEDNSASHIQQSENIQDRDQSEGIKDPKLTSDSKAEDNSASHIQQSENIQYRDSLFVSFWAFIILICVIFITELVLLRYFSQIFNYDFQV